MREYVKAIETGIGRSRPIFRMEPITPWEQ
jgi:hypothetical protein